MPVAAIRQDMTNAAMASFESPSRALGETGGNVGAGDGTAGVESTDENPDTDTEAKGLAEYGLAEL